MIQNQPYMQMQSNAAMPESNTSIQPNLSLPNKPIQAETEAAPSVQCHCWVDFGAMHGFGDMHDYGMHDMHDMHDYGMHHMHHMHAMHDYYAMHHMQAMHDYHAMHHMHGMYGMHPMHEMADFHPAMHGYWHSPMADEHHPYNSWDNASLSDHHHWHDSWHQPQQVCFPVVCAPQGKTELK
jgi:hypothetical protein